MQTAGRREPGTGARQTAAGPAGTEALAATLGRLDVLLTHAAARMRERHPAASSADAFRGLFVDHDDAARLLERQPLEPSLLAGAPARLVDAGSAPFARLAEMYELDGFELDTIAVALAPELDLRYERLYGYLQDDVTRKRPTVDLVLDLICPSPSEKLARRTAFACEAALVRNLLVRIVADPAHVDPPLLAHFVKLDEQVVNLLLGQDATHPRLAAFSRIIVPGDDSNGARDLPLARLIGDARRVGRSLVVH